MSNSKIIKVSEFSITPKGRYNPEDGPTNGQLFREKFLEPIWNDYDKLIIDLDDIYGCPSSFREESFGGLVRKLKLDPEVVLDKLEFICNDRPPLADIIREDIRHALDK